MGIFHTYMHVYMYDNIIYLHLPCGVFPAVAPKGIIFSRSCKEKSFVQKKRRCKHRSAKKGRFFGKHFFSSKRQKFSNILKMQVYIDTVQNNSMCLYEYLAIYIYINTHLHLGYQPINHVQTGIHIQACGCRSSLQGRETP